AFLHARGFDYSKADRIQTLTVNVNPLLGAAESAASPTGWRLQSEDGWVIAISDDALSLETTRYSSWAYDFRRRLEAALSALNEIVAPEAESRLGLRFVDIITTPTVRSPGEWRGRISDWLLAPALHSNIGSALTATQQQLSLDLHDGSRAVLRHGTFMDAARDGAYTYLLDCDIFRERLLPFDLADIQNTADRFHLNALSLFQAMITPEFRDELRNPV
ncbi:MAG: TIGR04255 family protein, partial [Candidatus Cybelea sp.]